ncbi:MAG: biopolymer transporter ExbD [Planctomycetaceae bacterium]|nr:biopolymer transporter ExbD [Planctomycetaceae bacterium]
MKSPRTSALSLTPMIDVTFQLLIFFLIGFQMRPTEGLIPAALPGGGGGLDMVRQLTLRVGAQGDAAVYRIDGTTFWASDAQDLYQEIVRQKVAGLRLEIRVRTDGDVAWDHVVEAVNAVHRAKVPDVILLAGV